MCQEKSKENINKSLKLFKDVAKTKFGQKPTRDLTFDELDKLSNVNPNEFLDNRINKYDALGYFEEG